MRKLGEEDVENILKLRYVEGMTIREIARKFGISDRRVQQILKNPSLSKPGRKKQEVPPHLSKEILDAYSKGLGVPAIHRLLNEKGYKISKYMIWRHLKDEGIIQREHKRNQKEYSLSIALKWCVGGYCSFLGVLYLPRDNICPYTRIVFGIGMYNGIPLRCSIFGFDRVKLSNILITLSSFIPRSSRALIVKAPPWVPTRRNENKLTKFLKRREVAWRWTTYGEELRYLSHKISSEELCFDLDRLMRMLRSEFKKFAEVG